MEAVSGFVDGLSVYFRNALGEISKVRAEYSFFISAADAREHCDLVDQLKRSSSVRCVITGGDWVRVQMSDPEVRRALLKKHPDSPFVKRGIVTYEGDLDPLARAMVDWDVKVQRPRRCYFDIETDSRVSFDKKEQMRVLSWVIVDGDTGEVVAEHVLAEETDDSERVCLAAFWKAAQPYDQLLAWNGDGFDFVVMEARTRAMRVPCDARRWLLLDHLALFRKLNTAAESGDEKQSMALQNVAMHFLGEGKDDFNAKHTYEVWASGEEGRARLLKYNRKDARLLWQLEQKTGFVALFDSICEACGVFGDTRGLMPTRQADAFMLRLAKENGAHFPTKRFQESSEQFAGAYVMEPKGEGILRNVHVADFASLYPSIMLTWNISPDTKGEIWHAPVTNPEAKPPSGMCVAPGTNITFSVKDEGLITKALRILLGLRKSWNDKKSAEPPGTPAWKDADRKSTAYKVVANSFYGVIGSPGSRFYDSEVGESVTQNGVWLIKRTIAEAKAIGMDVIYADTDSLFVVGGSETEFGAFVDKCNKELYPALTSACGCVENHIKLAYEKAFDRVVFSGKKRYAGVFSHYKGKRATKDSKPEIKGFEFKRGDTALLARQMQERVINMLLGGEERHETFRAVLNQLKDKVLSGELRREEVVLSKSLTKPLKEYVTRAKADGTPSAEPAHVQIARILHKRGEEVGVRTRIEFVVVDAAGAGMKLLPGADFDPEKTEFDRFYLWENLVYPPTQRFLEAAFPGVDWVTDYAKVRPPKNRRSKTPEGQIAFSAFKATERHTCVVLSPERFIPAVVDVARRHPGALRLVVDIGGGAVETDAFVSGTQRFLTEIEQRLELELYTEEWRNNWCG